MNSEKLKDKIEDFKAKTTWQKVLLIVMIIALIIMLIIGSMYIVGTLFQMLIDDKINPVLYTLQSQTRIRLSLAISGVFIAFFIYNYFKNILKNQVGWVDERGIKYLKNPTNDNSRFMTNAEIEQAFTVGPLKESTETIFGRMTKTGNKKVVTWKKKTQGSSGNKNDLIIASMGSGKTFTYVNNELIQTILRGDSFVASDPKGELFQTITPFLQTMGVETHVLAVNGQDNEYSECWNCLQECINPDTERIDGSRLNEFVGIYLQNTGNGKQDFWYECALNLIKAAIGYIAYIRETDIQNGYIELYQKVNNLNGTEDFMIQRWKNNLVSFKKIKSKIREVALTNGYNLEEINEILDEIDSTASKYKFNLGEVFDLLLHFKKYEEDIKNTLEKAPPQHPAYVSYFMYATNESESVKQSALQGAQLRFNLLSDAALKETLSHDGISIPNINKKQTAIFVIMSDKSNTYKAITSLFFSFLFKDLMENYDKENNLAAQEGRKNQCLGVTAMLEEFASIGVISGDAESFGKIMSTCRSRKVYAKVIIQYYPQLEALYGPYFKAAVQGGCSSLIYLGGNDPDTLKFISEYAGKSTIQGESHSESDSVFGANAISNAVGVSEKSRPLITTNEARLWHDRVLLIKQGELPVKLYPFPWTDHWVVKEGIVDPKEQASLYKFVPNIEERIEAIEIEESKKLEKIANVTGAEMKTLYDGETNDRAIYISTIINRLKPYQIEQNSSNDLEATQELTLDFSAELDDSAKKNIAIEEDTIPSINASETPKNEGNFELPPLHPHENVAKQAATVAIQKEKETKPKKSNSRKKPTPKNRQIQLFDDLDQ